MQNYELHSPRSPGHAPIKTWTRGVPVDPKAVRQLRNVATLPFVFRHVAAMPDMHWGLGATVGSVIATRGAVIPAAVGVDIGCGMIAQGYAAENRRQMMQRTLAAIENALGCPFSVDTEAVNCHHNVQKTSHGKKFNWQLNSEKAISFLSEIAPFLVLKKEQVEIALLWWASRSKQSRGDDGRYITVARPLDEGVIRLIAALKKTDIDAVMAAQHDLIEVVHTLKQVVCVKG